MDDKIKERLQQEVMALAGKVTELTAALKRVAPLLARTEQQSELIASFLRSAYPVDTSIDARGYRWSEAYLDQARAAALAAPASVPQPAAQVAAFDPMRPAETGVSLCAPTADEVLASIKRARRVAPDTPATATAPAMPDLTKLTLYYASLNYGEPEMEESKILGEYVKLTDVEALFTKAPDSRNVWTDQQREQFRRDQKTGPRCEVCTVILGGQHFPGCSRSGL